MLIIGLVAANGFFVAAEFALVKVRLSEIRAASQAGSRSAQIVERMLLHLDGYLAACQLGITLASLGLGWVGEPLVARSLEPLFSAWNLPAESVHYFSFPIAFFVITFLHITAGEQAPKIFAIRKYQLTAQAVSIPLYFFYKLFRPFIWFLNGSSNLMLKAVGITDAEGHGDAPTEAQLRLLLGDSHEAGAVTGRERTIMENVLDMADTPARRCMLPRNKVVSINRHDAMEAKLKLVASSGHTRLPLCDGDLDHVIGIVHVKDVFQALVAKDHLETLLQLARPPLFVPETISLDSLLRQFQKEHTVLAMLVDEYGGVSGMITLENVIEELVGPIEDEFDVELPDIVARGPGSFEIAGECPLSTATRVLRLEAPEVEVDTVGGLIVHVLGQIPEAGERVRVGTYWFTVLEAEPTRVVRLLADLRLAPDEEEPEDAPAEPGKQD